MLDRANTNTASVKIQGLSKIFGKSSAAHLDDVKKGMTKAELLSRHNQVLGLRDINIDVAAGSLQVIMGLSGSGKSTLIRHINRLIEPTAGQVLVEGTDVVSLDASQLRDFRRNKTAMVFQKFGLLPHRNVLENTLYGLKVRNVPRAQQLESAMRWIERVGLKGFETKYPNQLSGGMQQRVGLARALTNDAPILLMDEAFSALDPLIRVDMQSVLLDLQKEIRKTIIFITHDLDEALRLSDSIAILRDGEVVQQGTSQDILMRPANDYITRFVETVNYGRVIRVKSITSTLPKTEGPSSSPTISEEATLEEASLVLRNTGADRLEVADADGKPLGLVTLREVMNAMIGPRGSGGLDKDGTSQSI